MTQAALHTAADEVLRITEEEARAIEAGDIEDYLALLSPDVAFMPQNAPIKSGEELCRWMAEFLRRMTVHYQDLIHLETIVRDDLAYHAYACRWTATPKSGGEPVTTSFKGVHLLRRQQDGSWKIARSIWNTDPSMPNS
jgi:ketosteroid isomerase-like protein